MLNHKEFGNVHAFSFSTFAGNHAAAEVEGER
jgi:hypothetical protein